MIAPVENDPQSTYRLGCFAFAGAMLGAIAGGVIGVLVAWLNEWSKQQGHSSDFSVGSDFGDFGTFIEKCIFAFVTGTIIGAIVGCCSGFLLGHARRLKRNQHK
jgi:ABC-type nitrate/sulfonate/bicarbonate transport system permease component